MNATVRDVMTRDVVSVNRLTSFKDIARTLFDLEVSAVPVLDDERRVTGIVCAADLVEQQARWADRESGLRDPGSGRDERGAVRAQTLMTSPVVTVTPETDTASAARLMHRNAVKHLPVVDAEGRLVGIVSEKDLLTVFLRPDPDIREEIVREVLSSDPVVDAAQITVRVDDGIVTLAGTVAGERAARRVVALAENIDGVVRVVDQLSVVPEP